MTPIDDRLKAFADATAQRDNAQVALIEQNKADLSAPDGASLIGYRAFSDVSAAARTLFQKAADTINIRDCGARGDGTTDDTAALQKVIDKAIALGLTITDDKGGAFVTGPLDFNGTGHLEPANAQWNALKGFRGAGRMSTVFVAKAGAYDSDDWIIRARNTAGISYQGFGFNGLNFARRGFDFSWTGGFGGNPSAAPSNTNVLCDMYGEGVSDWGFNFDQCHDSVIDGIWSRGVGPANTAFTFRGVGGQMRASNIDASSGRVVMACQNGGFSDCVFAGGYEVTGSGYNAIVHNNVHLYPDPTTGMLIRSSGVGNASVGMSFNGCFFNSSPGWVIGGSWWQGAKFVACLFNNAESGFYATITPLAGTGDLPLFVYEHCTFFGTSYPGDIPGQALSSHCKSRTNSGASSTAVQLPGSFAANLIRTPGLVVGGPAAVLPSDSTASFQNGLVRFNNSIAGLSPNATPGLATGWNQSGGQGETTLLYAGGGGSDPRLDIVNSSAGTLDVAISVRNASLLPGADNVMSGGNGARRFTQLFAANATISTSDERAKQDIEDIPENVLRAWGEVKFRRYRMRDAVQAKGGKARWHFGVIAQELETVFKRHGIDALALGLLCYDEWGDEWQEFDAVLDDEGAEITPARRVQTQTAGNRFGIRYEEALILEAAYLRWRLDHQSGSRE